MLRAHGVVGKFVEFYGPGLSRLGLADRATISNMSPEFGATATLFPIDDETLRYLRMTGRPEEVVARVEAYAKAQGLFRTDDSPEPAFSESLSLDLATVVPSLAGSEAAAGPGRARPTCATRSAPPSPTGCTPTPTARPHEHCRGDADAARHGRRGQRRVVPCLGPAVVHPRPASAERRMPAPTRRGTMPEPPPAEAHYRAAEVRLDGQRDKMRTGSVVIAAITSLHEHEQPDR